MRCGLLQWRFPVSEFSFAIPLGHITARSMPLDAQHGYRDIEDQLDAKCYFATPYHSWERGSNENFNGLLRQFLPKGTSFRHLTQADCDRIARILNTRPRKRFNYKTPEQMYARSRKRVALAG